MTWQEKIKRFLTTRYTLSLEEEVIRLRSENRALVNSVLSIAGLPPLRLDAEIARENRRDAIASNAHGPASHPPSAAGQGILLPANAHRRRSWQQINRILEIEESRQITTRDNSDAMRGSEPLVT
ncbi:MAG: hypothetical protein WCB14_03850 [Candidatus Acidiferrales bacterium]